MNVGAGSGWVRRTISIAVVVALGFSGSTALAATPGNTWSLTGEQKVPSVPVHPAAPGPAPAPLKHDPTPLPKPAWPGASESDVLLSTAQANAQRADGPAVQAKAGDSPV